MASLAIFLVQYSTLNLRLPWNTLSKRTTPYFTFIWLQPASGVVCVMMVVVAANKQSRTIRPLCCSPVISACQPPQCRPRREKVTQCVFQPKKRVFFVRKSFRRKLWGMEDEIDVFPTCRRWWVSGEGEEGGFSYRRDHWEPAENIFAESIKRKSDLPHVFFKSLCFRISGKREEESFFRARGRPAKVWLKQGCVALESHL